MFVSYITIAVYVAFVIGASLLVGLLPPLVNRPECKEDRQLLNAEDPIIDQKLLPQPQPQPNHLENNKNLVKNFREKIVEKAKNDRAPSEKVLNRINNLRDTYEQRALTNPFVKKYHQNKEIYPTCNEITFPDDQYYPWYNERLPKSVIPTRYDVEIYTPFFNTDLYDGYVLIHVDITVPTNVFLVHYRLSLPMFEFIQDKNGNKIEIDCVGEYPVNDYFVIRTKSPVPVQSSPLVITFMFVGFLDIYESGLFEFYFGDLPQTSMIVSKFEPLDARKAFPCLDEPGFKPIFNVTIDHPDNTIALFNTPKINDLPYPGVNDSIRTLFAPTPNMPTYLIGMVIFKINDFDYVETTATSSNIPVRLWARKKWIEDGFGKDPLEMAAKILKSLDNLIQIPQALPPKIDIFAVPIYEEDAIPHLGLPVFKENRLLFKTESASERDLQTIALLIAKQMAEIYFGNYVTFGWWDELWLQEGLADYMKYRIIQDAYPTWNIYDQFVTEELINVLVEDGYPSSHPISKPVNSPYEIEEYFDSVESSKVAGLLRMVEDELSQREFLIALKNYLSKNANGIGRVDDFYSGLQNIRKWPIKEFMERWTTQANYPLLQIRIFQNSDSKYYINVIQDRALNSEYSIFADDLLYPSPYNWTWYVPLTCLFGIGADDRSPLLAQFDVDTKNFMAQIGDGNKAFEWVHCDRKFTGYFATAYSDLNWERLAAALQRRNPFFESLDRANIIHNAFVNSFTERNSYQIAVDVMAYLAREENYIPWKTVSKHLSDMAGVLEYKRGFYQVSNFFITLLRQIELKEDLWEPSGIHVDELRKETILELACRLQDSICINTASTYWRIALSSIITSSYNNSLPPYVRPVVYNYHFQNTYNVGEWDVLFRAYDVENDLVEQHRYLEALTFSRLPWLLSDFIESEKTGRLLFTDFFDAMKMLSKNQLGREIAWDYYRMNWLLLVQEYSVDDPRLGHLLLDIASTFENEFLFYELIEFIFLTTSGASVNARFKALEIASTNVIWLEDKQEEIIRVFGGGRKDTKSVESEEQIIKPKSFKVRVYEILEKVLNRKEKVNIEKEMKKPKFIKY